MATARQKAASRRNLVKARAAKKRSGAVAMRNRVKATRASLGLNQLAASRASRAATTKRNWVRRYNAGLPQRPKLSLEGRAGRIKVGVPIGPNYRASLQNAVMVKIGRKPRNRLPAVSADYSRHALKHVGYNRSWRP